MYIINYEFLFYFDVKPSFRHLYQKDTLILKLLKCVGRKWNSQFFFFLKCEFDWFAFGRDCIENGTEFCGIVFTNASSLLGVIF